MARKIVVHRPGGTVLTIDKSSNGLHVFLERASFARDSTGAYLRPGSHRPETRSKQTPINATTDGFEHVYKRINGYEIREGSGPNGGQWAVYKNGKLYAGPFNSKEAALNEVEE